jgi:hypothetical protein
MNLAPSPTIIRALHSAQNSPRKRMHHGNFRPAPVVRAGSLIGIITDRDTWPFLGHLGDIPVSENSRKCYDTE